MSASDVLGTFNSLQATQAFPRWIITAIELSCGPSPQSLSRVEERGANAPPLEGKAACPHRWLNLMAVTLEHGSARKITPCSSGKSLPSVPVGLQHRLDAGLVAGALSLEPIEHILVDPQGYRPDAPVFGASRTVICQPRRLKSRQVPVRGLKFPKFLGTHPSGTDSAFNGFRIQHAKGGVRHVMGKGVLRSARYGGIRKTLFFAPDLLKHEAGWPGAMPGLNPCSAGLAVFREQA